MAGVGRTSATENIINLFVFLMCFSYLCAIKCTHVKDGGLNYGNRLTFKEEIFSNVLGHCFFIMCAYEII